MSRRIVITRPQVAAERFAEALARRIGDAKIVIAPVLEIRFQGKLPDLGGFEALIFTSQNGVEAFAAQSKQRDLPCYCVGTKTAEMAEAIGLTVLAHEPDAARFVPMVQALGSRLRTLHIRGVHARGRIAERLSESGQPTREAILYDQVRIPLEKRVFEGAETIILPLFSPRSAREVAKQYTGTAGLVVIAISEAAAEEAAILNPMRSIVAREPDMESMVSCVIGECAM